MPSSQCCYRSADSLERLTPRLAPMRGHEDHGSSLCEALRQGPPVHRRDGQCEGPEAGGEQCDVQQEQRVVGSARRLRNTLRGSRSETVGRPDDVAVERVPRVEPERHAARPKEVHVPVFDTREQLAR